MKLPLSARQAAVFFLTLLGLGTVILAQDTGYALKWHSLGSGGASSGGGYTLRAFVGGMTAATSSGGGLTLIAGAPPGSTIPPTSLPDLVVESMTITLESGGACNYASTKLGLRIGIANRGQAAAGANTLAVNGSTRVAVGALAQGASTSIWVATYLSGENVALIDVDSQIVESDETNNRLTQFLPVPTLPPTCTPTATPTSTSTPTMTPQSAVDKYEPDDTCLSAQGIDLTGVGQPHTFHRVADEDWVRFDNIAGATYQIDAVPREDSPADLVIEWYTGCKALPDGRQGYPFSDGVHFEYMRPASGTVYLRLLNHDPAVAGVHVGYQISVRRLDQDAGPGALILVAGRKKLNDPVQPNINRVARNVYDLFRDRGYTDDRILYLSVDLSQAGVDAQPSVNALRTAITSWALDKVDAQRPLTLFLVDHGDRDVLYLDDLTGQRVTPTDLDGWFTTLENTIAGLKINVIVEACKSGSFIVAPGVVSKPGRVIVSATTSDADAYTSDLGAIFSDHFLAELGRNSSLAASFAAARQAAKLAHPRQNAWLDGDGDGVPNEQADEDEAAQRGFGIPGTLGDAWPPFIAAVTPPAQITNQRGILRATVLDDTRVQRVWAVIYPPDYTPPESGDELVTEVLPTIVLQQGAVDVYAAEYTGFDKQGVYRIVIYADDEDGLPARPAVLTIDTRNRTMLPLIVR